MVTTSILDIGMNRMKLIYLATPYSKYEKGRNMAFYEASMKTAELMLAGHYVFSPIVHSHSIEEIGMGFAGAMDGDWWLNQDFAVLERCDELWVYQLPGWNESYGVRREMQYADDLGIPIKFVKYNNEQTGID